MRTRIFKLNESEAQALQVAYPNCQDGATCRRYQAVCLYGIGYGVDEVMVICGCRRRSLLLWCQRHRSEGIAGLVDHRLGGNRRHLLALEIEALSQLLQRHTLSQLLGPDVIGDGTHWCIGDLTQVVCKKFGVRYKSQTSYRTLLERCDFSYQRVTKQYKWRSEANVMDFEEQLEKT